jgi:hypothetical protein
MTTTKKKKKEGIHMVPIPECCVLDIIDILWDLNACLKRMESHESEMIRNLRETLTIMLDNSRNSPAN